jgi:uncharacterized membrane protein (DUF2068 family)
MTENTEPVKHKAPTLYAIIAGKFLKGLVFLSIAIFAYLEAERDLPTQYENLLHGPVFRHLRLNPERKFWVDLATRVGDLTQQRIRWAAAGTLVYSLFSLVEATGLMFRVRWIGWMTIGESAFFIPIEVLELVRQTRSETVSRGHLITVVAILAFNILIVWYLFQNRDRLFGHHEENPK